MYEYRWKPRVPVAQRRAAAARKLAGVTLSPVVISGRTIAHSFWGKSWCDAIESYGDFDNRLPRGRTYARNGSVVDLRIEPGVVRASVSGSELYKTTIQVKPMAAARWQAVVERHATQVSSLIDLLQGKLPASLLRELCDTSIGLFPRAEEMEFSCSCPDWAYMCKHVAAALYGVGARLDHDPGLFFVLRGVEVSDLAKRSAAVDFAASTSADEFAGVDLGSMFGIDLAEGAAPKPPAKALAAPKPQPAAQPKPGKPATHAVVGTGKAAAATQPTRTNGAKARTTATAAPQSAGATSVAPAAKPAAKPPSTANRNPSQKSAPIVKPRPARPPVSRADLRGLGVDSATMTTWLKTGLMVLSEVPGHYLLTPEVGPQLMACIAGNSPLAASRS